VKLDFSQQVIPRKAVYRLLPAKVCKAGHLATMGINIVHSTFNILQQRCTGILNSDNNKERLWDEIGWKRVAKY